MIFYLQCLEEDFGGRSGTKKNSGPKKGADLEIKIDISFEEAFLGIEKELTITRNEKCDTCHGTGAKPGTTVTKCPHCHGTGQVTQIQNTMLRSYAN